MQTFPTNYFFLIGFMPTGPDFLFPLVLRFCPSGSIKLILK